MFRVMLMELTTLRASQLNLPDIDCGELAPVGAFAVDRIRFGARVHARTFR